MVGIHFRFVSLNDTCKIGVIIYIERPHPNIQLAGNGDNRFLFAP